MGTGALCIFYEFFATSCRTQKPISAPAITEREMGTEMGTGALCILYVFYATSCRTQKPISAPAITELDRQGIKYPVYVVVLVRTLFPNHLYCLMKTASFSKSAGEVIKILRIDCSEQHCYCSLDYSIFKGRNSYWALALFFLLDPHSLNGWRFILTAPHSVI